MNLMSIILNIEDRNKSLHDSVLMENKKAKLMCGMRSHGNGISGTDRDDSLLLLIVTYGG